MTKLYQDKIQNIILNCKYKIWYYKTYEYYTCYLSKFIEFGNLNIEIKMVDIPAASFDFV